MIYRTYSFIYFVHQHQQPTLTLILSTAGLTFFLMFTTDPLLWFNFIVGLNLCVTSQRKLITYDILYFTTCLFIY